MNNLRTSWTFYKMSSLGSSSFKSTPTQATSSAPSSSTPIFDWISTAEANLILHPPTLPVSNVMMAVLCMKAFEGKTILLMSTDPQAVSNCIGVTLPENMFLPYTVKSELLQSACQCACYIFIDNLTLFRQSQLGDLLSTKIPETKCVIFATSRPGLTELDLKYVKSTFPDLKIGNFMLADPGPTIEYQICPSLLPTPPNSTPTPTPPTSTPPNSTSTPPNSTPTPPNSTPTPTPPTPTSTSLEQIRFVNPKIFQMILSISLKQNVKHLVFCEQTSDICIIQKLLSDLKICFTKIEHGQTFENHKNSLRIYNQSDVEQQCVLLTNVCPIDDVHNIWCLHVLNGVSSIQLSAILFRIHRRRLFSLPIQKLTVYFHIAQKEDGSDAGDATHYRQLTRKLSDSQAIFDLVQHDSQMIVCSGTIGLCVSTTL